MGFIDGRPNCSEAPQWVAMAMKLDSLMIPAVVAGQNLHNWAPKSLAEKLQDSDGAGFCAS